jgi:hypothetical protein
MKKLATAFLLCVFLFPSCENKTSKKSKKEIPKTNTKVSKKGNSKTVTNTDHENDLQEPPLSFPKTGKKASDFLPKLGIYKIQYEAKGDLNQDGLNDIALVLAHTDVKTAERPVLILLQNQDKSYRLDKLSTTVMAIEYAENDFKTYENQEISIQKGILKIQLYGIGPNGNLFSHFKYVDKELILSYIESYSGGAGSWKQLYYNLEKGELTEEITNTMQEEMLTKEKTFKLKKVKHKFEDASPDKIILEAYEKVNEGL